MKLIDYSTTSLMELFKTEYYNQFGDPLIIGSDEASVASVYSYCLSVLVNALNVASNQRFIDTATGEFLDAIAQINGLTRPDASKASALFSITRPDIAAVTAIPINGIEVSDTSGNVFTNTEVIPYVENEDTVLSLLYCTQSGSAYNGIPAGSITEVSSQYAVSAVNATETSGGDDGYPYTETGDDAFREYIKVNRSAYAVGGSASAYKAKAFDTDNRIKDVYVIKDGDSNYIQGKVQIKLAFGADFNPLLVTPICQKVLNACSAEDFRPIGDLVEVSKCDEWDYTASNILVKYPLKFQNMAIEHYVSVMEQYRNDLSVNIGMAYSESELAKRLITPDENGVYAIGFEDNNYIAGYVQPVPGHIVDFNYPAYRDLSLYISNGVFSFYNTGE